MANDGTHRRMWAAAVAVAAAAILTLHALDRLPLWSRQHAASPIESLDKAYDLWSANETLEAARLFRHAVQSFRRLDLDADPPSDHPLLAIFADDGTPSTASFRHVSRVKLRHDAEQLELLIARGRIPRAPYSDLAELLLAVLDETPDAASPQRFDVMHLPEAIEPPLLRRGLNRAVHLYWPPRSQSSALAPRTAAEWAAIEERFYQGGEPLDQGGGACAAHNGIVVIDNLLSEATLAELLRWCEESTMWFTSRAGYVGAFHEDAFNAPLLLQVAEELRTHLRPIVGDLPLRHMWAFKYSNRLDDWPPEEGVPVHADMAAINVNLWLTPRAESSSGGLTVFTKQAPASWTGFEFNAPGSTSTPATPDRHSRPSPPTVTPDRYSQAPRPRSSSFWRRRPPPIASRSRTSRTAPSSSTRTSSTHRSRRASRPATRTVASTSPSCLETAPRAPLS